MALVDYVSLSVMKLYINVNSSQYDGLIADAITASSRDIDDRCARYFGKDESPSARQFIAKNGVLFIDDAINDGSLVVEDSDGNEIDTFTEFPLNGLVRNQPWPTEYVKSCSFAEGVIYTVTATWGWPEVPSVVTEACKLLAAETFLSKDTPHGVKGIDEFGVVRIRETKQIMQKLSGVIKYPVRVRLWDLKPYARRSRTPLSWLSILCTTSTPVLWRVLRTPQSW